MTTNYEKSALFAFTSNTFTTRNIAAGTDGRNGNRTYMLYARWFMNSWYMKYWRDGTGIWIIWIIWMKWIENVIWQKTEVTFFSFLVLSSRNFSRGLTGYSVFTCRENFYLSQSLRASSTVERPRPGQRETVGCSVIGVHMHGHKAHFRPISLHLLLRDTFVPYM